LDDLGSGGHSWKSPRELSQHSLYNSKSNSGTFHRQQNEDHSRRQLADKGFREKKKDRWVGGELSSFLRFLGGVRVPAFLCFCPRLNALLPPLTLSFNASVCNLLELFHRVLPEVSAPNDVLQVHWNVVSFPPEVFFVERAVGVVVDGKEHPLLFNILSDPLDEYLEKNTNEFKNALGSKPLLFILSAMAKCLKCKIDLSKEIAVYKMRIFWDEEAKRCNDAHFCPPCYDNTNKIDKLLLFQETFYNIPQYAALRHSVPPVPALPSLPPPTDCNPKDKTGPAPPDLTPNPGNNNMTLEEYKKLLDNAVDANKQSRKEAEEWKKSWEAELLRVNEWRARAKEWEECWKEVVKAKQAVDWEGKYRTLKEEYDGVYQKEYKHLETCRDEWMKEAKMWESRKEIEREKNKKLEEKVKHLEEVKYILEKERDAGEKREAIHRQTIEKLEGENKELAEEKLKLARKNWDLHCAMMELEKEADAGMCREGTLRGWLQTATENLDLERDEKKELEKKVKQLEEENAKLKNEVERNPFKWNPERKRVERPMNTNHSIYPTMDQLNQVYYYFSSEK
jgi:hypothetical protein